MSYAPPPFGEQSYWDDRFKSNPKTFEWLGNGQVIHPFLAQAYEGAKAINANPQILHIGFGTSDLAYHLRAHVDDPKLIHNVDYSEVAVERGRRREREAFGTRVDDVQATAGKNNTASTENSGSTTSTRPTHPERYMRWSQVNLLDPTSLLATCEPNTYSVIVDKSTSDSIACSEALWLKLPYEIGTSKTAPTQRSCKPLEEAIHPVHILAIHMALLTKPGARWISVSYSEDRYPFLRAQRPIEGQLKTTGPESADELELDDDLDDIALEVLESGLPDPSTLWELEVKCPFEAVRPETPAKAETGAVVHRPVEMHYVYVLKRTDVPVFVRETSFMGVCEGRLIKG